MLTFQLRNKSTPLEKATGFPALTKKLLTLCVMIYLTRCKREELDSELVRGLERLWNSGNVLLTLVFMI